MAESLLKKQRPAKTPKQRVFVAALPGESDLPAFLEGLYATRLIRMRHPDIRTMLIVAPANRALAEECGLFDEIIDAAGDLSTLIRNVHADIIYVPSVDFRLSMKLLFSGSIRIAGGARLGKFLRFFDLRRDGEKLKKAGLDMLPESVGISFRNAPLPDEMIVYASLFDEHNVSGSWPVGHAARLSRLLSTLGAKMIVPLPEEKFTRTFTPLPSSNSREFAKDVQYLKKYAPEIQFVSAKEIQKKAEWMRKSSAIVAPAGSETVFAALLHRPVVTLHDMQSHRMLGKPDARSLGPRTADPGVLGLFAKIADSLDRHLMPQVEECIEDCPACTHLSCVDTISPERVFENVKRILMPY
jgi:ADP-heptose:LPS heptosyltransferase